MNDADLNSPRWFEATSAGLFTSKDHGKIWMGGPVEGEKDFVSVQAQDGLVVAATRSKVLVSQDEGKIWQAAVLASYPINIRSVTLTPDGQVLVATREGVFHSTDSGKSWNHVLNGLPDKNITSVTYDGSHKRLLATSGRPAWFSRAQTVAAAGSVDRTRDTRCAASAWYTAATWRRRRLMA